MATATLEKPKVKATSKTPKTKTAKPKSTDPGDEIVYSRSTSVTKSGQIFLPREIANSLCIEYGKDRLEYHLLRSGTVIINRELHIWDRLPKLWATFTPEQKAAMKALGNKTVAEMEEDWANSAEGRAQFKEEYGL